jgi:hypothetical protein
MDRCTADAVAHVTGVKLGRRSLKFMKRPAVWQAPTPRKLPINTRSSWKHTNACRTVCFFGYSRSG